MNDARTDAPTAGSNSMEAYEEDWYRSLRALAERRASEIDSEDEVQERAEDPSPDGGSSAPSAPTADASTRQVDAEPSETDASAVPPSSLASLFDRPRTRAASSEGPPPGPWAVPAPPSRQPSGSEAATSTVRTFSPDAPAAAGASQAEPPIEAPAGTKEVEGEPVDAAASAGTKEVEGEPLDAAASAGTETDVPEPPQKTSPWARMLRPLERIQLSPLRGPGERSETQAADEGATGTSEETPTSRIEPPGVEVGGELEEVEPVPAANGADDAIDGPHEGPGAVVETGIGEPALNEPDIEPEAPGPDLDAREIEVPKVERSASADPETFGSAADAVARGLVHGALEVDRPKEEIAPAEPAPAFPSESEIGPAGTESASDAEANSEPERQLDAEPGPEQEPARGSLTSLDATTRKTALAALQEHEPSATELDTVAALVLDPDAEIRRMAVETLSRTPARLDDGLVRQALQDPADEVRAAAVRAAATRGIRDLPTLAPLVDARRSPETHRTVLQLLPKILGETQLTAEALDPLLLAIAQMQPPPDDDERSAFSEIAASIGTALLIDGLMLPDVRRLGAVRLLAGDRSPAVLHALAERAGDPLEEVRQAGLAAADEIARNEAEAARAAGPPDIGALAEDLRNPDPERVERALTALSDVDRSDLIAWCRERLARGDAESVAVVASLAAVLDLDEIGVELLTRGASLPSERRRSVIEALTEFPDPSKLAGLLALVPPQQRADAVHVVWEASGRRILPDLRDLLADPAVQVRVAVIDIAGDAEDPASIEAVAGLLATDTSAEVRAAAVRAISKSEGALPNVIGAVGDSDPLVRATAVASMPPSPASEVGPVLAQALTDHDERVRRAAIERLAGVSSSDPALAWSALRQCRVEERNELLNALQRSNPSQVLEIALEHLYSPDQDERTLAVELTGWGASQAAVESAIRALGDPSPEVRRAAVGALGRLRDRSAVSALGKALADPDPDVRVGTIRALGVIDDEGVLAFLVAALKDPDHRVRETTSQVLTEWSSPAVAKRLAGILAVPSLRDSAADLLRRIGPTSVELLIDVLIQGSAEIRNTVGALLEQIIGVEEFLGRMDSLEPERRLRAIEALAAIAQPLAVDALMRSLSDPDERIRLRATQLLGELGDRIATDAVRRLVDDPVPEVAAAARRALETNLDGRESERRADG